MPVTIAENVSQNVDGNERDKLQTFSESPGYGGQRIRIKIGGTEMNVAHVTYGAGQSHVSIFYNRSGDDYRIVGVGQHDGKDHGKTVYSALWDGRGEHRVKVTVLGTK